MKKDKKYALLDADFIIKANIARKDSRNRLIDWLVSNLRYQLVCHEKTLEEISVHDKCGASDWLVDAIDQGVAKRYTDEDIVNELCNSYGFIGLEFYRQFLKESCDSMSAALFEKYYRPIIDYDLEDGKQNFLSVLSYCDQMVGSANSLGERKTMILLQFMQLFYPKKVYLFCSDDRSARRALYSIASIPCKSIMTLFF